jgi:threonine aldolase
LYAPLLVSLSRHGHRHHIEPTKVAVILTLEIVFAALFAITIGRESMTLQVALGGIDSLDGDVSHCCKGTFRVIDLRSDTVTAPTDAMRQVIASAPVGDDVYGDDPTVNALEERVAALFGKEAGLFCPTGSLANQLMMRTLVQPGQEILAESNSHVVRAELGAAATFSGITTRTWTGTIRTSCAQMIRCYLPLRTLVLTLVSTTAIAIENTHNFGGGTVQPLDQMKLLYEQAHAMGIAIHLDGARIWNAHVASGVALS